MGQLQKTQMLVKFRRNALIVRDVQQERIVLIDHNIFFIVDVKTKLDVFQSERP